MPAQLPVCPSLRSAVPFAQFICLMYLNSWVSIQGMTLGPTNVSKARCRLQSRPNASAATMAPKPHVIHCRCQWGCFTCGSGLRGLPQGDSKAADDDATYLPCDEVALASAAVAVVTETAKAAAPSPAPACPLQVLTPMHGLRCRWHVWCLI